MPTLKQKSSKPKKTATGAFRTAATAEMEAPRYVADASFATTLANGLAILSGLKPEDDGISNTELARRLGLPRPTISRLCGTLVQLGYLRKGGDRLYRPGPRVLTIAYPLLANLRIRNVAWPNMRDFAEHRRFNVSLVALDHTETINVATVRQAEGAIHIAEAGMAVPMELSSAGCALLSMQSPTQRRQIMQMIADARPENWEKFEGEVKAAVQFCEERSFCISLGHSYANIFAAAAPLGRTPDGIDIAINCGVPSYRATAKEMEEEIGPQIAALAHHIRSLDQAALIS